jgi:peptidoglycan/xylan/chitin deacetylase (PgdA/CDA1 family)
MGASAEAWIRRAIVALWVVAGIVVGIAAAIPVAAKIAIAIAGVAVALFAAFRSIPGFDPLGRVRWRLPASRSKTCALTFDDGPSEDTNRVLDVLAAHRVRATFFVLSGNARRHPRVLRRIVDEGHTLAVHGTTHRKLHRADERAIEGELGGAITELERLGARPAPLYRTPHGLKNGAVLRVAKRFGFDVWAWSRGVWDTDRPPPSTLVDRATRFARSRMVLLLHDGRGDETTPDVSSMIDALPLIVRRLRARGFEFVTLHHGSRR